MPMRLVKLQISNFCFRFPFKHPDAIKQIEPSSKTAYAAPYQGLPVSHITWEGCCLHKQKKLTPSLLGFTSNFAGDCTVDSSDGDINQQVLARSQKVQPDRVSRSRLVAALLSEIMGHLKHNACLAVFKEHLLYSTRILVSLLTVRVRIL